MNKKAKVSSKSLLNKVAGKKATPLTDALGAITTSFIPFGNVANTIGAAYGGLDKDRYEQQDIGGAFIPGVGAARLRNRLKSQVSKEIRDIENNPADKDARPVRHTISEQLSPMTSLLASTAAGAGIGKLMGNTNKGAGIGAAVGGSGILIGSILAALHRRRTAREQIENDKKNVLQDLLIPGVGAYNISKRIGRSQGDRDELEAKKSGKSEKKAEHGKSTLTDDYMHGFCKAASDHRVDPEKLVKAAGLLKALGILAGVPMAAGAIGGKLSQESGGGRVRNSSIGAASGAAALGGISALHANKLLNEFGLKNAPKFLKAAPLLAALTIGGSIGSVGGGLTGALFGEKEKPKTLLEKLLARRK